MEAFFTIIISVVANVVAYYVCKWLDRERRDN